MTDYRFATPDDVPDILRLLDLMHSEVGMASLNKDKVAAHADDIMRRGVVIVGLDGDRIVCTMGLLTTQWWYTSDWHLAEQFVFVHPDFRKSAHAPRMLRLAREIAREMKLPLVAGVLSNKRVEAKCRLFRRHFRPVGMIFLHEG